MAYIILGAWAWVYVHFETMNGALNQWLGLDFFFFYGELLEANRKNPGFPKQNRSSFPIFFTKSHPEIEFPMNFQRP